MILMFSCFPLSAFFVVAYPRTPARARVCFAPCIRVLGILSTTHENNIDGGDGDGDNSTSGTTGNPKGALLTHRNFIADAAASEVMQVFNADTTDVYLSYLPLPHIFERMVQVF